MRKFTRAVIAAAAVLGLTFGAVAVGMYHHGTRSHAVADSDMYHHG